jgi:hypothetical protein
MNSLGRAELAQEEFVGLSADSCFKMLFLRDTDSGGPQSGLLARFCATKKAVPTQGCSTVSALAISVDRNHSVRHQ